MAAAALVLLLLAGTLTPILESVGASSTVTQTFSFTGSTQMFTVPPGVTAIGVTLLGGQGGRGGGDSQGSPTPGGYQGVVTGSIDVTPGQVITVAVGGGGGTGVSSRGSAAGGSAGSNPLADYDGAVGGVAGPAGSSGGGGGSGAATVVQVGGRDLVAGGAGGNGGNGQFLPIVGRRAEESFMARPDTVSTSGRPGLNTANVCSVGYRCDGGASGAGGGGAQGGERGDVQYGGDSATEYFGFGGFPGANDTTGFPGTTASYGYYAGNGEAGSVVISYESGTPGAPGSVTGAARPGSVAVAWNPPSAEGGAPITDYVVQYATGSAGPWTTFDDGTTTTTATTVTRLTNGTTYFFRVSAVNSYGAGPASAPMTIGVIPSDVPSTPSITAVVPFDSGLYVDFTPGRTDSPVTGYQYRLDGGTWQTAVVAGSRATVNGLTNGRVYGVEIRALNAIGPSTAAGPVAGTPRGVAGAPSSVAALAGDGGIIVTWQRPDSDNGSPVTDYVVQVATAAGGPYDTYADGTSVSASAVLGGLANGTNYYVRVAAVNGAGTGAFSSSIAATPYTVPGAPAITGINPGDGSLGVTFTEPASGGSAITGFQYRLGSAGPWTPTGTLSTTFAISALTNGMAYDVAVRAVNAAGAGPASTVSNATPATVPAAPSISAVALDTGAVGVSFAVGSDGGSPVTNFEFSLDGGSSWVTRSPAGVSSPITIGGLVGGQTYSVMLRAVNAVGSSAASNQSTVTAKGAPQAPDISGITSGDRTLRVSFASPANGGTPITNYEYSVDGGTTWTTRSPASTASPVIVSGLTNGTAFPVRVRAVNAVGSGAASSTVVGTPRTTPGAPSIDSGTVGGVDGAIDVTFTAPVDDGGSTITTYQYSTDAGATWRARGTGSTSSPLRITALSVDGSTALIGGRPYPVEIRAVNVVGAGVASATASGMTTTVPEAPTIEDVSASDASATVTFAVPANGGATTTRFEYRLDGGAWLDTGSLSNSFVISSLVNATTYAVRVRAVNAVGAGPPSAPVDVTVRTAPGAPTVDRVESGDRSLSVAFTPGVDGGSSVTTYQYSTDGGATWRLRGVGTTASPLVITSTSAGGAGLSNGTIYAVQIRAVNIEGAGDATVSRLVAPRGVPDAPGSVSLGTGDGQLVVSFDESSDGGSPITSVEYRLGIGTWVDAGSLSSPFTVGGLTNGTAYGVTVRLRNALGAGPASALATATPLSAPGAPGAASATVADSSTVVSWTVPASDGGSAVTGYLATLYDRPSGGVPVASCSTAGELSCSVSGLTNGSTGYVAVTATNPAGTGPASAPRVAVTPLATPRVGIASLTAGPTQLDVDVDVTDTGGTPISTFEYRLNGGTWISAATAADPFTIGQLTTGVTYAVQVRAVNVVGTGPASAVQSATPRTVAGAPGSLSVVGGDRSVTLNWVAPVDEGGAAVTDYVVQYAGSVGGPYTTFADGVSAATSSTVTGLTNGTAYVFRVAAVNAAGTGAIAGPVAATPLAVPDAPTITSVTPGSRFLQVAVASGASNGGTPVTGYEYRLDDGSWRPATNTGSPLTITGLVNGRSYSVAVRSVNAVGSSVPSNVRIATPYGLPGAIGGFLASPGTGSVQLTWDPVDDNGSAVTAYNIIRWSAASEGAIAATYQTVATTYTVNGLANGTYWFTIEATNAAGTGPRSSPRFTARVGSAAPGAPTITSARTSGASADLRWTSGGAGDAVVTGYVVRYVPDTGSPTSIISGTAGTSASIELPSASAPYELRVAQISPVGVGAFTTIRPPITSTAPPSTLGTRSATANGATNANGSVAVTSFEYATSTGDLGTGADVEVAAEPTSVNGSAVTATSAALTGLAPGTAYWLRSRATSGVVVAYGEPVRFTTQVGLATSGLAAEYRGSGVPVVTVTDPAGVAVVTTYEGIGSTTYPVSSIAPTDVGTYRATTTVDDGALVGRDESVLTISPKAVTVMVSAVDRPYDGTIRATLQVGLSGIVSGDEVVIDPSKLTGTFADAAVGRAKTVSIAVAPGLIRGVDAVNYVVSVPATAVATVSAVSQTLRFAVAAPGTAPVGSTFRPVVESSAGLPVDVVVADGSEAVCSLTGGEVSFLSAGICVLVATQSGNPNVGPAQAVAQVVTVVATPSPGTPASRLVGPAPTSGVPGTRLSTRLSDFGPGLIAVPITGPSTVVPAGPVPPDAPPDAPPPTGSIWSPSQEVASAETGRRRSSHPSVGRLGDRVSAPAADPRAGAPTLLFLILLVLTSGGLLFGFRFWRSRSEPTG